MKNGTQTLGTMPPEILGEIFTWTSSFDNNAPLVLDLVSWDFHEIVRATPGVWTSLTLDQRVISGCRTMDVECCMRAEMWFRLAGARAIDVNVTLVQTPSDQGDQTATIDNSTSSQESTPGLVLPHFLRSYVHRIKRLVISSPTDEEAQTFLSALYSQSFDSHFYSESHISPAFSLENASAAQPSQYPLRELVLRASAKVARSYPNYHPHPTPPISVVRPTSPIRAPPLRSLAFPCLSQLTYLDIANAPLPEINPNDMRNIVVFRVACPLRFAPIPTGALLALLESMKLVEKVDIEGRIVVKDDFGNGFASSLSTSTSGHSKLLTLPYLTSLSLRINNLPAILSALILPSLHTLKLDDLDGKRPGGAMETGALLRGLLVRMELPLPVELGIPRRDALGLEVLHMCNIGLCISSSRGKAKNAGGNSELGNSDGEVWAWCFRRMRMLKELEVQKMDTGRLLSLVTASSPPVLPSAANNVNDGAEVLPRLEKLIITDPPFIQSYNSLDVQDLLRSIYLSRPGVQVEYGVTST